MEKLYVCVNLQKHMADPENGFTLFDSYQLLILGAKPLCDLPGCNGTLVPNQNCRHVLPGTRLDPPEECGKEIEAGEEMCFRHRIPAEASL